MFVYNVMHYLLGKEHSASLTRFYDCSLIWIFTLVVMRVLASDTGTVTAAWLQRFFEVESLASYTLSLSYTQIYGQVYDLHLPT